MSNIRDVAKAAGVSAATVSRAFTSPSLINVNTHQRVLEAARMLNYSPSVSGASRVAKQRSAPAKTRSVSGSHNTIGFQFFAPRVTDSIHGNEFYGPILMGAESEASSLGLHLLLNSTNGRSFTEEMPTMIREQLVGGMLLVGTTDPTVLSAISQYVPNLVLVDSRDETNTYESVYSNGFGGAYAATQHLIDLGHRDDILFLFAESGAVSFRDRLRGYLSALFDNDIVVDSRRVFRTDESLESHEERVTRLMELLQSDRRPSGIVCVNDGYAQLVMQCCWNLGIRIPDDLSVVGFDDVEFSRHACPPLTTVRVDKEYMGRLAVRRLYMQLQRSNEVALSPTPPRSEVDVTLVARDSCRAV